MAGDAAGERPEPLTLSNTRAPLLQRGQRHQLQFFGHGRSSKPILGHMPICLEIKESGQSVRAEYPVHFAGVEAKGVESALQVGDVVAAEHRQPMVQQPIAQ